MPDNSKSDTESNPNAPENRMRQVGFAMCLIGAFLAWGNVSGKFPTYHYLGTAVATIGLVLSTGTPGRKTARGHVVTVPAAAGAGDGESDDPSYEVNLRQPGIAAFWAWLVPGAGHFYQRRYAKGVIFFVCILFTYFFGLALGGGRVVYASFERNDFRWQYVLQLGVGAPALPALVQSYRVRNGQESLWPHWMAPPEDVRPEQRDELADWHYDYNGFFDKGELYTMIAGLLNVLAIYDAYAGPLIILPSERERGPPNRRKKKKADDDSTESSA